jgi:hypothetical protein
MDAAWRSEAAEIIRTEIIESYALLLLVLCMIWMSLCAIVYNHYQLISIDLRVDGIDLPIPNLTYSITSYHVISLYHTVNSHSGVIVWLNYNP